MCENLFGNRPTHVFLICPVFYGLSPFESISNDLLKSNLNYGAETK
jgi:hypothetical protein